MNKSKQIQALWEQFQQAIDTTYQEWKTNHDRQHDDPRGLLDDYATNQTTSDDLGNLVVTETKTERQHRTARPYSPSNKFLVSATDAAKLLLMGNAADGSEAQQMPPATIFIQWRRTAAEAHLLGYLAKDSIGEMWRANVRAIDYTKLHN